MSTLLRTRRAARALSAADLARDLGVHPTSLLRWERRERLPGPDHVRALAAALAVDVTQVASFFDEARPPAPPVGGLRGHGLRALRRRVGLPAQEVARHLGVPSSTVYNWEAGRVRIPEHHLPALAPLLGVPRPHLGELLRAAAPPAPAPVPPLRRLRRRTGLSQEAVAHRVGTTRRRLGAWERGEAPPLWAVRRLAGVYGVPVARLAALVGVPAPRLLDPASWRAGDLPGVLATLRGWSGLTQAEVADRCDLHRTTVRGWENGRAVPSDRSRARLERLHNLPDGSLLAAYPRG